MVSLDDVGLCLQRRLYLRSSYPRWQRTGRKVHIDLPRALVFGRRVLLAAVYFGQQMGTRRSDFAVGGALGLASVAGQTSLGLALCGGIPGAIVCPVTLGGGLFIVVGVGVLLFGERVGPYGVAGIVLGIISIVLLSF